MAKKEFVSRKSQKAATRQAVKEAARACFNEKGFGATAILDITNKAGVAPGTFYVHFKDKDEVVDELLRDFNGEFVRRAIVLWQKNTGQMRKFVDQLAQEFISYWEADRDFVSIYAERASSGLGISALRDGMNPEMMKFIAQVVLPAMSTKPREMELIVHGLLGLWMRVGLQYLYSKDFPKEAAVQVLSSMTWGALQEASPHLLQVNKRSS